MLGLDIAYLCTKFDHCSFRYSGDMVGSWYPPKFKLFTWPDHAPFRDDLSSLG